MDAWETRYGEQRAAAIDRLEQLCLEKHHLKMPSLTVNPKIAKKKNVDVSQLKAPTPSEAVAIEDAQHIVITPQRALTQVAGDTERPLVKAGKFSVTVKPHGLKTSFAAIGSGKIVSSRKSLSSPEPEPMSTGGDSERYFLPVRKGL